MTRQNSNSHTSSSTAVMQTLQWARKNDFRAVAVHKGQKAAISRDYITKNYKTPDDQLWKENDYGIGIVTGPAHNGPIDIDLDCEEAVFFANRFLPPTKAVFGRKSKRRSHYLYRLDASSCDKLAYNDPTNKTTIVELRADNGHQTVFPGSIHEGTGELIEWDGVAFPEVTTVAYDVISKAIRKIAIATLLSRHVWADGYHNEPTKHLTGMFYYLEWTLDEVEEMIEALMEYSGDEDKSRIPTVRTTFKRAEAGKKVSGSGVLRKQLNNDIVVDRLLEWAGSATVNLIQEYNERFAVVNVKGKFRIASTEQPGEAPYFMQREDFIRFVETEKSGVTTDKGKEIPKSILWLASPRRRTYRTVDFLPGVEESSTALNLWTGWGVQPAANPEAIKAWSELLHEVICDGDEALAKWMWNWLANIVLEPMDKSLTAPVLIGQEGAGKSLLFYFFGKILGPAYQVVTQEEHIHGKFNQHLATTLLLHSEEALYGGDKKHASVIRSLITDPFRMSEQKGVDAIQVRNYMRLALTSNDVHAAPARPGDRRYTVIDMKSRKATKKLAAQIMKDRENGGPEALLHHFFHEFEYDRDLPRVNMKNDALSTLKGVNYTPIESWWHDVLESGQTLPDYLSWCTPDKADLWPTVVSSVAMYTAMTIKLRERGVRMIPNDTAFSFQLTKMVDTQLFKSQRQYANPYVEDLNTLPPPVRLLGARQSSIINMPTLEECRKAFERYIGQQLDWPKEDVVSSKRVAEKKERKY